MDEQMIRAALEIDAVPILPRDCDGGTVDLAACAAGFHPDERIGIVDEARPDASSLMTEADKMAYDADWHARRATTWRERFQWWAAKQSALSLAWHLSHINGTPREQSTYTSLSDETPWGITLGHCWIHWMSETRGNSVPL